MFRYVELGYLTLLFFSFAVKDPLLNDEKKFLNWKS